MQAIPNYLKRYCKEQAYDRYTSLEHASWRYIMRQSREFFSEHAVGSYLDGLKQTGLSIDRIPRIDAINEKMVRFGWGAVGVSGFIPPLAFLDFQSRKIMPIAMDMRTLEHIGYTPAPDIVHEAAGHLPMLADVQYRNYLGRYALMAKKAIQSKKDISIYEAIRRLSDIKENPDASKAEIDCAENELKELTREKSDPSEQTQVARMNWWTAEYGLVGELENPLIYGAGLLSSVAESRMCLSKNVKKVRLGIDCVLKPYDITEPQPQLFVAKSLDEPLEVLEALEKTLAYHTGGVAALAKARESETVNTVLLDTNLSVSGVLECYLVEKNHAVFLKFSGPVQLCHLDIQLAGHGRERHPQGFSSPVGRWRDRPDVSPSGLSDSDLGQLGVTRGNRVTISFISGFSVSGRVKHWIRQGGQLILITWEDCTVRRGESVYFQPEWGEFDLVIGMDVVSVFGGPADREHFGDYEMGRVGSSPGRTSPFSDGEKLVFGFFDQVHALRHSTLEPRRLSEKLQELSLAVKTAGIKASGIKTAGPKKLPADWLLHVEIAEVAVQAAGALPTGLLSTGLQKPDDWVKSMLGDVRGSLAQGSTRDLFDRGVATLSVAD